MKNIFKRNNQMQSKVSFRIRRASEQFDREQHKWADYLNGKTKNKSRASLLIGLVIFCVFFGGSSVILIFRGFYNKTEKVAIQKITIPGYVITKDSGSGFFPLAILTNKQYTKISKDSRRQWTVCKQQ